MIWRQHDDLSDVADISALVAEVDEASESLGRRMEIDPAESVLVVEKNLERDIEGSRDRPQAQEVFEQQFIHD